MFVRVAVNFVTLTLIATTLYTLSRPTLIHTCKPNSKLPYTHEKQTT